MDTKPNDLLSYAALGVDTLRKEVTPKKMYEEN